MPGISQAGPGTGGCAGIPAHGSQLFGIHGIAQFPARAVGLDHFPPFAGRIGGGSLPQVIIVQLNVKVALRLGAVAPAGPVCHQFVSHTVEQQHELVFITVGATSAGSAAHTVGDLAGNLHRVHVPAHAHPGRLDIAKNSVGRSAGIRKRERGLHAVASRRRPNGQGVL